MAATLRADVYVSSRLTVAFERSGEPTFSPISCTLIQGATSAVLVDTPISIGQTEDLVRWIKEIAPRKNLIYIYITHGHADHFLGISTIQKYWPGALAVATAGTVAHMKQQIAQPVTSAQVLGSDTFQLEGHDLKVVEVGHSDTYDSTVLYVPSLSLVVAGDVVYGDVHMFLAEANSQDKRRAWLAALDLIEALHPQTIVAGHKRAGTVDGVFNLHASREYIGAFGRSVETSSTWEQVYEKMMDLYPSRINTTALIQGAKAAFTSVK